MYYVIVNPASRSGRGCHIWPELNAAFLDRNIPYQVAFSNGTGHVTELVRKLTVSHAEKHNEEPIRLILLGGDGTVNESLQGITDFDKVMIGYIPTGSSNDLARSLKLPGKRKEIIDRILAGQEVRRMDLGRVTYHGANNPQDEDNDVKKTRYFAVSSGIGFDAAVCQKALHSSWKPILNKVGLGKLTYLVIALKQLLFARKVSCTMTFDDGRTLSFPSFLFCAFMIHPFEGGGFQFCPDADYRDGLLDLCLIGRLSKVIMLLALPTAFWGKHYMFKEIHHFRVSEVSFQSAKPLWVHTDGEVDTMSCGIDVTCQQEKIRFML